MLRFVLISYTFLFITDLNYVRCFLLLHIFSVYFKTAFYVTVTFFLILKEKYLGRVTCDVEIPVCAFLITLWTHYNLTSYVWVTYFLTERMKKSILHIMKLNEWAAKVIVFIDHYCPDHLPLNKYYGTTSVATLALFRYAKHKQKCMISE